MYSWSLVSCGEFPFVCTETTFLRQELYRCQQFLTTGFFILCLGDSHMQMTDGPADRWRKMQTGKHNKTHYNVMNTAGAQSTSLPGGRRTREGKNRKPKNRGEVMLWERKREWARNWRRELDEEVTCWWAHGCGRWAVSPSASQKWHAEESTVDDEAVRRGCPHDGYKGKSDSPD